MLKLSGGPVNDRIQKVTGLRCGQPSIFGLRPLLPVILGICACESVVKLKLLSRSADHMTDVDLFHFDDTRQNFEALARDNGFRHWLASDLMRCLGYDSMAPVQKAVNKAIAACATLGIAIGDNFVEIRDGATGERDWHLSRFACYLTAMNGDTRKQNVAKAQVYFATLAESFRQYANEADQVERVLVRGEISERESALSSTAKAQGVENYAFFQNAGYRGMYNMNLNKIRQLKQVPSGRSPLDFMGKTELAANLFRITQTDEKIKNENVRGQKPLERTAERVGREVRDTMRRISGTTPERLPPARDINNVRSDLKLTNRQFAKLDKPTGS